MAYAALALLLAIAVLGFVFQPQLDRGLVDAIGGAGSSLLTAPLTSLVPALALLWAYGYLTSLPLRYWKAYKVALVAGVFANLVFVLIGLAVGVVGSTVEVVYLLGLPLSVAAIAWVYGSLLLGHSGEPLGIYFGAKLIGLVLLVAVGGALAIALVVLMVGTIAAGFA